MLKYVLQLLLIFFLHAGVAGQVSGQNVIGNIDDDEFIVQATPPVNGNPVAKKQVPPKAISNFENSFKEAADTKWYHGKSGYRAYFILDTGPALVAYDEVCREQYKLYTITENLLPRPVWRQVKSVYYSYGITWANKVQHNKKTIYIIRLSNHQSLQTVKIDDGKISLVPPEKK